MTSLPTGQAFDPRIGPVDTLGV